MSLDPVVRLTFTVAAVTDRTCWSFIELQSAAGLRGTGEATLAGREAELDLAARRLAGSLLGPATVRPDIWASAQAPADLAEAAVISAVDQALWDLEGRRRGRRVAGLLAPGQALRERIGLYANINRRTIDRSDAGFAASARDALAAGFEAFKIAPFDEVTPEARAAGDATAALQRGLSRIAAVASAVGPRRLMVDCHWRLDEAASRVVIDAAAELGLWWVECPLPETDQHLDALVRLRGRANARGVRLAGCEQAVRLEGFEPFLKAGAYDVMMPDAKYAGGLAEMLRIAEAFAGAGVAFSPHNPSGPVCHAASVQVCAALTDADLLEVQFDETPRFQALQGEALPDDAGGAATLAAGAGLGLALDAEVLASLAVTRWSLTA